MSKGSLSAFWKNEDYWAIWFGFLIIAGTLLGWIPRVPKIGKWSGNPLDAFLLVKDGAATGNLVGPLIVLMLGLAVLTAIGVAFMRVEQIGQYLAGFLGVFVLATLSCWVARQENVSYWGLSYPLWALLVGLLISNTIGTPAWLKAGAKTELFIKTGLVLLGAEVLFKKILVLGPPGLMVAWIVTPIVVIFMYIAGTRWLKMRNRKLVMIVASATAAACRAKKEDLTLGVGMTLIFTVLMMFFMPLGIKLIDRPPSSAAPGWEGPSILRAPSLPPVRCSAPMPSRLPLSLR